jgi:hypothetical protein
MMFKLCTGRERTANIATQLRDVTQFFQILNSSLFRLVTYWILFVDLSEVVFMMGGYLLPGVILY